MVNSYSKTIKIKQRIHANWCYDASHLKQIEMDNNENYLYYDNFFLLIKSAPESECLVLIFARIC